MDTRIYGLLRRLEENPSDQLAWQQVKRLIKKDPEKSLCLLFFGHLAESTGPSTLARVMADNWSEIFAEMLTFYRAFLERTKDYGDVWGGGREFWLVVQFLEVWVQRIIAKLSPKKSLALSEVLNEMRSLAAGRTVRDSSSQSGLPFLPQEVAWNLTDYLESATILADYPEFRHMYFLPSEILPLALELENYKLSPHGERYFSNLLHETRRSAYKTNLLNFAKTFPLVVQAKWAYALYISLDQTELSKHPFVRRLLANSYWEARASGHIAPSANNFSHEVSSKRC